jgi:hypothetical protein
MTTLEQDAPTAARTCDRCEMTIRWTPPGGGSPTPPNWIEIGTCSYCLVCRRELAVVEALEQLGTDTTAKQRAERRSAALIEFEVERSPDRRDGEIARSIRCSAMAVGKARQRLQERAAD